MRDPSPARTAWVAELKETGVARILAADDDPSIRQMLALALGLDHRIETVEDGEALLETLVNGRRPDVVLLDIMMPRMDGLTVLGALRRLPGMRKLPVILLTAKTLERDHLAGWRAGADGYVTKPFDLARLEEEIQRVTSATASDLQRVRDAERHKTELLRRLEVIFDDS